MTRNGTWPHYGSQRCTEGLRLFREQRLDMFTVDTTAMGVGGIQGLAREAVGGSQCDVTPT